MMNQLEKMNLIDNFLFSAMIDHEKYGPAAAQTILETILQREVKIGKVILEKVIAPGGGTAWNPDGCLYSGRCGGCFRRRCV